MPGTILCVDDDRNLVQIVGEALVGEGYQVLPAYDGEEALRLVSEKRPGLILMDIMLPKLDGFEVIEAIRALPAPVSDTPIVIMTACTRTPQYTGRARDLNTRAFLTKPVPLSQLLDTVSASIAQVSAVAAKESPPQKPSVEALGQRISGDLSKLSFPALLHHLHGMRATGLLLVSYGKKRKGIQMKDGYPVAVKSNQVQECLGNYLVRSGKITRNAFKESLQRLKQKEGMQGEILVAMEALTEEELTQALQEQADEKIYEVFSWPEGKYRFDVGGQLERANAIAVNESPANVILKGVMTRFSIDRIDVALTKNLNLYLVEGESPFYQFQEVAFSPEQKKLLQGLSDAHPLSEYVTQSEDVRRFLYAMLTTGLLELDDEPDEQVSLTGVSAEVESAEVESAEVESAEVESAAAESVVEIRPQGLTERETPGQRANAEAKASSSIFDEDFEADDSKFSVEEEALREELTAMAERFDQADDFSVLDIVESSTDEEVRSSYVRLAKLAHPDRFSGSSAPLLRLADEVFSRISVAFENLGTANARAAYVNRQRLEKENQDAHEEAHRVLQAENWFKKGEGFLKRKRFDKAVEAFGMAAHLYPQEGEYLTHLGYALHLSNPDDEIIRQESMQHLAKGIKLAPDREKSYLFLGRIYKATNDMEMARKMFARAVQIKSDCHEALQELRLINLRAEKSKSFIKRILRK